MTVPTLASARELRDQGKSIRAIAAELNMSKSAVHRALRPVPTQNFGAGHTRARHARETLARIGRPLNISREAIRQVKKVAQLAEIDPERYGDLHDRLVRGSRIWPVYQEAIRRLSQDIMLELKP